MSRPWVNRSLSKTCSHAPTGDTTDIAHCHILHFIQFFVGRLYLKKFEFPAMAATNEVCLSNFLSGCPTIRSVMLRRLSMVSRVFLIDGHYPVAGNRLQTDYFAHSSRIGLGRLDPGWLGRMFVSWRSWSISQTYMPLESNAREETRISLQILQYTVQIHV